MVRCHLVALLLVAPLALAGCGLAESVAGNFVDDEDVVLAVNPGRSGTVTRQTDGTDVQAQPALFLGGDTPADDFRVCVLGFSIDPSLQPDKSRIARATLRIWVDTGAGDPAPLAPLVVSHLPGHPDALLAEGLVPHPVGTDIGTVAEVSTPGWRAIDVTPFFLSDWNAGRRISAFALRLSVMTDGDGASDDVAFESPGAGARAELVLRFTLDL